jgi:hypothetical protein
LRAGDSITHQSPEKQKSIAGVWAHTLLWMFASLAAR